MTVVLDLEPGKPADALDLIRRVRAFGDEMRVAGMVVEVSGALTITVRPPARPEAVPKAVARNG